MKQLLLILRLAVFAVACNSDQNELFSVYRSSFVKGKSGDKIKEDFIALSDAERKNLWLGKVNQLLPQSLPAAHQALILELKTEMLKPDCVFTSMEDNAKLTDIAARIASITPREDLIQMFERLEDYEYKGKFKGTQICQNCIDDLRTPRASAQETTTRADLKDCNCRWGCDDTLGPPSSNCRPCRCGCGWFWLGTCDKRD